MKNYLSKIFVIHYTKLKERKQHMLSEIEKWGLDCIPIHFQEESDQESMTDFDISRTVNIERFKENTGRSPSLGELSLCIKYKKILEAISVMEDDEYVLVLEDDVIFKESPLDYINHLLHRCESENTDFDCIFMGEAALRVGDHSDAFYRKAHPATNGLCTVLYRVSAAKKLFIDLNIYKIGNALDWHFNKRFEELDFDVYWAKAITEHGSVTATRTDDLNHFKSSLREEYSTPKIKLMDFC